MVTWRSMVFPGYSILVLLAVILHEGDACTINTRVASVKVIYAYTRCGWWGWWRCLKAIRTTEYRTVVQCCTGYESVQGKCTIISSSGPVPYPSEPCGRALDRAVQIVGGTNTSPGEYPWMVALIAYTGSGRFSHFCGGTLVTDRWVLTAAHCIDTTKWTTSGLKNTYRARVGEHQFSAQNQYRKDFMIEKYVIFPNYDATTVTHDIALLKLTAAVPLSTAVKHVCLPAASDSPVIGSKMQIYGWGVTVKGPKGDNSPSSDIQKKADVVVASDTSCRNHYGVLYDPGMVCVSDGLGDTEKASCFGDSGGPMTLTHNGVTTQYGVTSFGTDAGCAVGVPTVYTDVSHYRTWLDSIMTS